MRESQTDHKANNDAAEKALERKVFHLTLLQKGPALFRDPFIAFLPIKNNPSSYRFVRAFKPNAATIIRVSFFEFSEIPLESAANGTMYP